MRVIGGLESSPDAVVLVVLYHLFGTFEFGVGVEFFFGGGLAAEGVEEAAEGCPVDVCAGFG